MTHVQFVPPSSCLLRATAEHLCHLQARSSPAEADFRDFVVVLPTARLGHFLLSALAQAKGAILPPKIYTIAGLFHAIDSQLPSDVAPPLPALAPAAMSLWLKALLAKSASQNQSQNHRAGGTLNHCNPSHSNELLVFYKELIENGLWQDWYPLLQDYIEGECFHHPSYLDSVMSRFAEVSAVLKEWRRQIEAAGLMPLPDAETARAQRVAEAIQGGALAGKTVVVAGLTTMAASWLPVIRALSRNLGESGCFVLPNPPPLICAEHPMTPLLAAIGHDHTSQPEPRQMQGQTQRQKEAIVMVEAGDALGEVQFVCERIRELLLADTNESRQLPNNSRLLPSDIAILVPSESHYSSLISHALALTDIPCNLAIAQPLSASALGSWWLILLEALTEGFAPLSTYQLLHHPFSYGLFAEAVGGKSHPDELPPRVWQRLYTLCTAQKPLPDRLDFGGITTAFEQLYPEDLEGWQLLRDGYLQLVRNCRHQQAEGQGQANTQGLPLFRELRAIVKAAYNTQLSPAHQAQPLERSAFEQIVSLLDLLSQQQPPGRPMAEQELWSHLLESSKGMAIRVIGEPMAGVQVLSLAEARWLPVQVAFVLGCNEGMFPRALPSDELLSDELKRRLGLSGWRGLEAMEDLSFSFLTARIAKVFLCRCRTFAGEDTVPSRFIEQLEGQRHHLSHSPSPSAARAAAKPYPALPAGQEGHIPAAWSQPWHQHTSATAVDRFLSCPYRYALDRLNLKEVESPFDDKAALDQGTILHSIFEQFHEGLAAIDLPALPSRLTAPSGEAQPEAYVAAKLLNRFTTLLNHHSQADRLSSLDIAQLRQVGFPRYVSHVLRLGQRTGTTWHLAKGESERSIDEQPSLILGRAQRKLHGQIDRIDQVEEGIIITDYKRDAIPKGTADQLPSAQLILYAKGLEALVDGYDSERMVLGYWSILGGDWHELAVGDAIRDFALSKQLAKKSTPALAKLWTQLSAGFAAREEEVDAAGGRFFKDDKACGFCSYAGMCRKQDSEPSHDLATFADSQGALA